MRSRFQILIVVSITVTLAGCHGSSKSPAMAPPPMDTLGLDARPTNPSCIAPPRAPGSVDITLEPEFTSLPFDQPLDMLQAPGDSSRWFVLEKTGRVRVFAADPATTSFLPDFIDLTAITNFSAQGEGGLLGMAFHPDYQSNGEVFLSWTDSGSPLTSIIARFEVSPGGQTLDTSSREDILELEQDFANHDGGHVAFGPDGDLYIGFGDGGDGGDPLSRAQDTRNLLGTILRLDVDGGSPYAIPSDNPFAGNALCPAAPDMGTDACPEIYAWGLRNPWRFSFDTATDALWAADVGQNAWEEIDQIERGGNYGWDCREGRHDFASPAARCAAATGLIEPVHEYSHSEGNSITGGFVYRGTGIPELRGNYLFADYGSGRLWRLVDDGAGGLTGELLLETGHAIAAFGQGNDLELHLVDIGGGRLYRLVPGTGGGTATSPVPERLSETGCMQSSNPSQPASGLIPYSVEAPFWSDGAEKSRWLAIPDNSRIGVEADGGFAFPPGSVLVKQFRVGGELIETRLMMRHPDGAWAGYSYEWDAGLNDGVLVHGGKLKDIGGQDWIFPSGAQCTICHTAAAGGSLGPEVPQLDHEITYPGTGRTANQIATLAGINVLDSPGDPANLEHLVDPFDSTASLSDRARAYLHTNCAQCHRPNGPPATDLDFRYRTALTQSGACDQLPQHGDFGLGSAARIIAPGNAADSVLVERMSRRDANGMPPLASNLVDTAGVALIGEWIDSLGSCF